MALVAIGGGFEVPSIHSFSENSNLTTVSLNLLADGDKIACPVWAPKDGTLDGVEFATGYGYQKPANGVRVSFQETDASPGAFPQRPNGVSSQYKVVPGADFDHYAWLASEVMTDDGSPGGVKRTVTQGEKFWVVFEFENFEASDKIQINCFYCGHYAPQLSCLSLEYAGGGYEAASQLYRTNLVFKYDDGTYGRAAFEAPPTNKVGNATLHNISNATDPDEIALRFKLPVPMAVIGAWAKIFDLAVTDDFTISLLAADDTVLASTQVKPDEDSRSLHFEALIYFNAEVELDADTLYRLSFRPDTAGVMGFSSFALPSAAHMAATQWGAEFYWSQRVDGGEWADTTNQCILAGLLVSKLQGAAGLAVPQSLHPIEAGITA